MHSLATLSLQPGDVDPVLERNADGQSPFLLICDHYGKLVPSMLDNLGLPDDELSRHIGWDIGIAGVAERLSDVLGAHLIAQRYSRLVIDCNRPPGVASSIPLISEATTVPGNDGLEVKAAQRRRELIFDPYHARIRAVIDARLARKQPTWLVTLHSFTPVYTGVPRPWDVGTLYQHDRILAPRLLHHLRLEDGLTVGDNQPYAVSDATDYAIPVHGEARGLPNTGIEIRQDLITGETGQIEWANRLARVFAAMEGDLRKTGA